MKEQHQILTAIADERARQDAKWGVQDWELIHEEALPLMPSIAQFCKGECERHAKLGTITWSDILLEEVYEAFAETDIDRQIEEMNQVAAVAVAIIECLERRKHAWSIS